MGRPPGSPNKMKKEDREAAKLLAEEYGDPIEDMLQERNHWKAILKEHRAKPSRHRNWKIIREAQEWIFRLNDATGNYCRPKYQAINHSGDAAPVPTVIRAPETVSDSKTWLEKYQPKRDDMVNDRPRAASAVIQQALDVADALDAADAVIANKRAGHA